MLVGGVEFEEIGHDALKDKEVDRNSEDEIVNEASEQDQRKRVKIVVHCHV